MRDARGQRRLRPRGSAGSVEVVLARHEWGLRRAEALGDRAQRTCVCGHPSGKRCPIGDVQEPRAKHPVAKSCHVCPAVVPSFFRVIHSVPQTRTRSRRSSGVASSTGTAGIDCVVAGAALAAGSTGGEDGSAGRGAGVSGCGGASCPAGRGTGRGATLGTICGAVWRVNLGPAAPAGGVRRVDAVAWSALASVLWRTVPASSAEAGPAQAMHAKLTMMRRDRTKRCSRARAAVRPHVAVPLTASIRAIYEFARSGAPLSAGEVNPPRASGARSL